jgi:hypothetical protein
MQGLGWGYAWRKKRTGRVKENMQRLRREYARLKKIKYNI